VSIWATHKLANPLSSDLDLRVGSKVVAIVDLPGVPEGTMGKVRVANGFNRQRYWVRFANGVELGQLDGRHLAVAPKS